jgi:hypothetical protein
MKQNKMEEFDIQSNWNRLPLLPASGTRCLVTDGDTIVIGTYASPVWILEGINHAEDFHTIGWMELPRPLKKIITYVEPSLDNNKAAD